MIDILQRKWDEIRENPLAPAPPPVARQLFLLLLRTFGRELPDIGSYQEVHHRLIARLNGAQLRELHMSASGHSPSHCFTHLFQERLLLVSPSAAVAEEKLPRVRHRPSSAAAPAASVVVSVSKLIWVRRHCSMSGL